MRVLLVDNSETDADLARHVLSRMDGLTLDHVSCFNSFKSAFSNDRYVAVISDSRVGAVSGTEILKYVRLTSSEVPFIVMSGSIDDKDAVEFLEMGATDYILKQTLGKLPYALGRAIRETEQRVQNKMIGLSMHDIMSPMTAISGYLDLIKNCLTNSTATHGTSFDLYNQRIQSGVSDINTILNQLRAMNKGKAEAESEYVPLDVDLNWITREVCEIMHGAAQKHKHQLIFDASIHPVYINVDIPHLKRILYNFISNAIRYTPEGGRIEVRVGINIDGQAAVTVIDNGIGIPKEKHDFVFRINAKVNKCDLYDKKSTGLGLYVNAMLAKQIGGTINLCSEPGVGTEITLNLPVCPLI